MPNQLKPLLALGFILTVALASLDARCEEDGNGERAALMKQLRTLADKQMKAMNEEDIDAAMATYHSESPGYAVIRKTSEQINKLYDLKYDLDSFDYFGQDADYVGVRVKFTTRKIAGPAFRENTVEALWMFRKEKGEWKFWSAATLSIKFLDA